MQPAGRPAPKLGPYRPVIDEWLSADREAPRKQRHTVTPLICSQIPRVTASRASSLEDQRESGTPCSAGSAHAIAITSART